MDVKLGDEMFSGQDVDRLAAEIEERGPILYADTAGGSRDIVVTAPGRRPQTGWIRLRGPARRGVPRVHRPVTGPRRVRSACCDPDGEVTGECDGREFPPDGEGLPPYPVTVRDGKLDIDLNAADRTSTTPG